MKLTKGSSIRLAKNDDVLEKVTIGCSWGEAGHSIDVDAMLFFMSSDRLEDIMYYGNNKEYRAHGKHYGDDVTGSNKQHESDNEVILVNLNKVPRIINNIVVVVNAYTGEKLSKVPNLKTRVYSGEPGDVQDILGTFDVSDNSSLDTTSVVVGYLKLVDHEWTFKASGENIQAHRIDQLKAFFQSRGVIDRVNNNEFLVVPGEQPQNNQTDKTNKTCGILSNFMKKLFS